jgi:citrate lyase beta subunit
MLCLRDLEAAVRACADGVMLPKTETAADVGAICWALAQIEAAQGRAEPMALVPLIETARGLSNLDRIDWDQRVRCVAFGSVDYALDLQLSGTAGAEAITAAEFAIVRASRAVGLEAPIGGVTLEARDPAKCAGDATRARELGFDGKLAIHPAQIEPIQTAFRPTTEEVAWASEVVDAFAAAERLGSAAILVRGRMVDYPVLAQAQRLLARAANVPR